MGISFVLNGSFALHWSSKCSGSMNFAEFQNVTHIINHKLKLECESSKQFLISNKLLSIIYNSITFLGTSRN